MRTRYEAALKAALKKGEVPQHSAHFTHTVHTLLTRSEKTSCLSRFRRRTRVRRSTTSGRFTKYVGFV
jgi:hypothetical protein